MGRKKSKKGARNRTYFKVMATFKCSKDECGKVWLSAHGWGRKEMGEEGGTECGACGKSAQLVNAKDEMLKLDSFRCPKESCDGNFWQSIHGDLQESQECDLCGGLVHPEKNPQERYGRHFWFKCVTKDCPEPEEWEDFALEEQFSQRCTKCKSRGDMVGVQKLKAPPPWLRRRRDAKSGKGDPNGSEEPTGHVAEYCDVCERLKKQDLAQSCHGYKKVTTLVTKSSDGRESEVIVAVS